jgi:hypothetical protein
MECLSQSVRIAVIKIAPKGPLVNYSGVVAYYFATKRSTRKIKEKICFLCTKMVFQELLCIVYVKRTFSRFDFREKKFQRNKRRKDNDVVFVLVQLFLSRATRGKIYSAFKKQPKHHHLNFT